MKTTTYKLKTALSYWVFLLFCSLSFADAEQSEYALSEELALYILDVYPGHQKRSGEEWAPIEAKVKALLAKGADPDLYVHKARGTALGATVGPAVQERLFFIIVPYSQTLNKPHYRTVYPIESVFRNRNFPAMKYLIKRGVSIDKLPCCQEFESMPFLYSAALKSDFELVIFLLGRGANINIKYQQSNPLRSSIKGKRFEMAKLLIEKGAEGDDFPLLHDAILSRAPVEILRLLVGLGYGPWSVDNRGEGALEYAKKRNSEAYEFLKQFN